MAVKSVRAMASGIKRGHNNGEWIAIACVDTGASFKRAENGRRYDMGRYYLTGDRENVQCIIDVGQSMTELHRRRAVGRMWSVRARHLNFEHSATRC